MTLVWEDGFESAAVGSNPANWTTSEPEGEISVTDTDWFRGSQSAKLDSGSGTNDHITMHRGFGSNILSGSLFIVLKHDPDSNAQTFIRLYEGGTTGTRLTNAKYSGSNNYDYNDGAGWITVNSSTDSLWTVVFADWDGSNINWGAVDPTRTSLDMDQISGGGWENAPSNGPDTIELLQFRSSDAPSYADQVAIHDTQTDWIPDNGQLATNVPSATHENNFVSQVNDDGWFNHITHRWQHHVFMTSQDTTIVPVVRFADGTTPNVTDIYRKPDGGTWSLAQTLSDADISQSGSINCGVIVEDDLGNLYATGHSNPKSDRTKVIYKSTDDGKTWSVLRNDTDQAANNPPHPHNIWWDPVLGEVWWLSAHSGIFMQTYDPDTDSWTDRYTGTVIESDNRSPMALGRANGRLWLLNEVTGPDKQQLYYSTDDGGSWTNVSQSFSNPSTADNDALWSIGIQPVSSGDDNIYLGGGRPNSGRSFVYKSADNGSTWSLVYDGNSGLEANVNVIDGDVFLFETAQPIKRSTDGGTSWSTWFDSRPLWATDGDLSGPNVPSTAVKEYNNDLFIVDGYNLYTVDNTDSTSAGSVYETMGGVIQTNSDVISTI